MGEFLIEKAREAIRKVDLSEGAAVPGSPTSACRRPAAGCSYKFGIALAPEEVARPGAGGLQGMVRQQAEAAYHEKEIDTR